MDLFLLEADSAPSAVRLWCKDAQGETKVLTRPYQPYFYVQCYDDSKISETENRIDAIEGVKWTEIVEKNIFGKPSKLVKVFVENSMLVRDARDAIKKIENVREQYEYGISNHRKYLIDNKLVPMTWFSDETMASAQHDAPKLGVMAFDIEVCQENGEEKIVMISAASGKSAKLFTYSKKNLPDYAEKVQDEKEMIEKFVQYINKKDPDVIIGYNSDRFDFQLLKERADKLGVKLLLGRDNSEIRFVNKGIFVAAKIRGRIHVDLYDFIVNIIASSLKSEILTLENVSQELIGETKEKMGFEDVKRYWQNKPKKLSDHCLKDAQLTLKLSAFMLPQMTELCKLSGQNLFDVSRMTYSQLVEALLMARTRDANEIIPNRPKYEEIEMRKSYAKYEGGYVREPKQGLVENIAVFDFRSLYPSIIVTHNIDISKLNCSHSGCARNKAPEKNYCFCLQGAGFIPKILAELLQKRQEIKSKIKIASPKEKTSLNNRQYALKIITNAAYGYYAYPASRWYSRECAESVAAFGRNYIHAVINSADSFGFEVVYGDTDSLFVTAKKGLEEKAQKFLSNVNKKLPGVMKLELDGIYSTGLFVSAKTGAAAKKRYALMDAQGRLVIRGFERVRRDWCSLAKETQEKVLKLALEKKTERAAEFVRSVVKDLRSGKTGLDRLVIYTQLSKPLNEYEQVGPHVAVAKRMFEQGRLVAEGTTIQYIITKGEGSIADRARAVDEVKPHDYDAEYYANNQVVPAALRVLKDLGYSQQDLVETAQLKLGKFLK